MDRAFLEDITREAGGLALEYFGRVRSEKKGASLVSEADRAVERGIVSRIRSEYPDDFILAEESGTSGSGGPGGLGETTRWWAVDPIDGTGPYLANLPFWAVSVACMRGSRAEGGANPPRRDPTSRSGRRQERRGHRRQQGDHRQVRSTDRACAQHLRGRPARCAAGQPVAYRSPEVAH